ncbi:Ribokinase-like protein [Cyathus striatus]|nr:Ribokinase-like protein [Cyathus striatus]
MACQCIVRGSINNDEYFYVDKIVRPGETISSKRHESRVGGKGANQSVAIVRAGGSVKFYGAVGKDGIWVKDRMASFGVDVGGIIVSDDATGRAIIQVSDDGENSIVLFPGANHSELHEKKFMEVSDEWFPEATHLLLQNEIHARSTYYALMNVKNATIIVNPSPLPRGEEIFNIPWRKVDWLVVNESEVEGLYHAMSKQKTKATSHSLSTRELVFLLSEQSLFQNVNIICTLGADGVLAFIPTFHRPKTIHEAPSFMHVPAAKLIGGVCDTTGAGDCFAGYFVQGLMEFGPSAKIGLEIREHNIARILKTCVHAAGMCVEKPGTIDSIPTRAEVEGRMSSS